MSNKHVEYIGWSCYDDKFIIKMAGMLNNMLVAIGDGWAGAKSRPRLHQSSIRICNNGAGAVVFLIAVNLLSSPLIQVFHADYKFSALYLMSDSDCKRGVEH